MTERTEETTNVYIGYAKCADGYDLEPCRGRLRPVSISASPTDKPAGADIQLSFPDGQLLEQTEDGFKVAGQSYPVAEIATKRFFLHGHTPSASVRDCSLKAVHSVSKSEDVLRYSVVHATFEVESDDHNPNSGRDLTDNRTAKVTILLHGFDPSEERNFVLRAEPKKKENIVNKCGTDITFSKTDDPLVWRTSKIYWYGNNPDECCFSNDSPYLFLLEVDHTLCASTNEYTVGWPDDNPKMVPFALSAGVVELIGPEPVPGEQDRYRCRMIFNNYIKICDISPPVTHQYADETSAEEMYHALQWKGIVPLSEGGQGDCYTAEGLKYFAGFIGDGPYYIYGDTPEEVLAKATCTMFSCIECESNIGDETWENDKGFCEVKAKEHVGYNAAWKYHCTYEFIYGKNPTNCWPNRQYESCRNGDGKR